MGQIEMCIILSLSLLFFTHASLILIINIVKYIMNRATITAGAIFLVSFALWAWFISATFFVIRMAS